MPELLAEASCRKDWRGSLLNHPTCPPDDPTGQGNELNWTHPPYRCAITTVAAIVAIFAAFADGHAEDDDDDDASNEDDDNSDYDDDDEGYEDKDYHHDDKKEIIDVDNDDSCGRDDEPNIYQFYDKFGNQLSKWLLRLRLTWLSHQFLMGENLTS